ncbi:hypothetical protein J6590_001948 [Homalodisca vitripennis]|nr:hypothetical protein J6590_001948 [Homalodisca vitripennis]
MLDEYSAAMRLESSGLHQDPAGVPLRSPNEDFQRERSAENSAILPLLTYCVRKRKATLSGRTRPYFDLLFSFRVQVLDGLLNPFEFRLQCPKGTRINYLNKSERGLPIDSAHDAGAGEVLGIPCRSPTQSQGLASVVGLREFHPVVRNDESECVSLQGK